AGELAGQQLAELLGVGHRLGGGVGHHRDGGGAQRGRGQGRRERSRRGGPPRWAPSSLPAAGSRSRAVHSPETTTLPGALSLATARTWSWAVASTAISTPSADSPSTELIDPGRASAARCIASARRATSSRPASNDSA